MKVIFFAVEDVQKVKCETFMLLEDGQTVSSLRRDVFNLLTDRHDLLQRLVAGSQFGHGERGGDADGGHEDIGLGGLVEGQLFVQRQGEATVGLRQLPHPGIGGLGDRLGDRLGLRGRALGVGAAVDAARLQRQVFGFGAADVWTDGEGDQRQERQNRQPIGGLHPGETHLGMTTR